MPCLLSAAAVIVNRAESKQIYGSNSSLLKQQEAPGEAKAANAEIESVRSLEKRDGCKTALKL